MGKAKPQKKEKIGTQNQYVTRQQAIRKLQLSLAEFRKLCILKGVYPRDPQNKSKGSDKTYYLSKDIKFMLHDPIIDGLREIKIWKKQVSRAKAKGEIERAQKLEKLPPKYTLNHLVKERYPTFLDALKDLDDAVTMTSLFAAMPVEVIPEKRITNCQRIYNSFQYYVIKSHSLRKVFLSSKGIYFQAEILGQPVTWIVPHKFQQKVYHDVDYKVMKSFLEFQEVMMSFVNVKLFHMIGLKAPVVDANKEQTGDSFRSLIVERLDSNAHSANEAKAVTSTDQVKASEKKLSSINKTIKKIQKQSKGAEDDMEVDVQPAEDEEDVDFFGESTVTESDKIYSTLFQGKVFFLGRETPRDILEFMIRSFGGQVTWDNGPIPEDSPKITYHVMDRPAIQGVRYDTRDYVQPQWVADSVNNRILLPVSLYAPGTKLPPHLSPFVQDDDYVPEYAQKIKELVQQARGTEAEVPEKAEEDQESDSEESEDIAERYQKELEEEKEGKESEQAKKSKGKKRTATEREEAEAQKMAQAMLPGKKRKLIEYVEKKQGQRKQKAEELTDKKDAISRGDLKVENGVLVTEEGSNYEPKFKKEPTPNFEKILVEPRPPKGNGKQQKKRK